MDAQTQADREGRTLVRVNLGGGYVVRAAEAKLWEMLHGTLFFPRGGERYEH